jgi:hypothetical protein
MAPPRTDGTRGRRRAVTTGVPTPPDLSERRGLVLTIPGASRELGPGFSPKTVRRLIARGLLPARQLGGKTVILRRELEQFLEGLPAITSVQGAHARAALYDDAAGR